MIKKLIGFLSNNNITKEKNLDEELSGNKALIIKYRQDNKEAINDIFSDLGREENSEITMPTQEFIINKPIEERRANIRMGVDSILLNPKNNRVVSISIIDGKTSKDELSNISLGGLQLISRDNTKKVGDIIHFKFKLGIHNFSLKGEVSNIVNANKGKKTIYGIKFIDVPMDQQKAIGEILGSIKLCKTFY